jgi:hypothetical protein
MPAKIFINNLDTYVSQAVWSEFRKDPKAEEEADEAAWVYGTYITKDSTEKPDPSCKKMLKVSRTYFVFRDVTFLICNKAFETAPCRSIHRQM